jgi:hypothetical protein
MDRRRREIIAMDGAYKSGHNGNGIPHWHKSATRTRDADRLPPHNIEAEICTIGSILWDESALAEILDFLSADHFYRDTNQIAFSAVERLHKRRIAVTTITLADELEKMGKFEYVGGNEFLLEVTNTTGSGALAANARYFAEIVRDHAKRRLAIELATDVLNRAYAKEDLADDLLTAVDRMIRRISAEKGPSGVAAWDKPQADLILASDIPIRPVGWLWADRIPLGMLTHLAGDPKVGKSLVATAIGAAVSRGAPLPFDAAPRAPARVIMMCAEDDPSATIVPRLLAAGADLTRISLLRTIREPGLREVKRLATILARDIEAIETAAVKLGNCILIIIDPVTAYLSGVNDHRNAELRRVLWSLMEMAERLRAAVVLVNHLNKNEAAQAQYRVNGSIAYQAACRANFLFVKDRTDPSQPRVLMCDNGCNLVPEVPTLSYRIENRGEGPLVAWGTETLQITAAEALRSLARDGDEQADRRACDEWLRQTLANGAVLASDLRPAAQDAGFSWDAVKRAKNRIHARTDRDGFGPGSKCYWRLCDAPRGNPATPIKRP